MIFRRFQFWVVSISANKMASVSFRAMEMADNYKTLHFECYLVLIIIIIIIIIVIINFLCINFILYLILCLIET